MNYFLIGIIIMQAASFSVGDELGFPESIGNLEGGRRRAISYKNGPPGSFVGVLPADQQTPMQHPLPDKRITSRSTGPIPFNIADAAKDSARMNAVSPTALMTEARPLPLGVPAFRPIPRTVAKVSLQKNAQRRTTIAVDAPIQRVRLNNRLVEGYATVNSNRTFHVANPTVSQPQAVPAFHAMPDSISKIATTVKDSESSIPESRSPNKHPNYLQFEEPKFDLKDISVDELAAAANVSVDTIKHAIYVREQQMRAEHRAMLAAKLRQEFIRTSSTTSTTPQPLSYDDRGATSPIQQNIAYENKVSKVMNAPKEYYPVGYDKNFDDNFKSKVDLPPTSFACGKQKHFPGLYADTDLGCMVFHVCALTDDGLVRKSFLCPENTLFDQTILKCNWWFYVDCNTSKSVYDSNIPISKSYQLMKSLTYFSKYTKNDDSNDNGSGLDIQTLKESIDESDNVETVSARSFQENKNTEKEKYNTPEIVESTNEA